MKEKTNIALKSFAALATVFTFALGAPALQADEKDHKHEEHEKDDKHTEHKAEKKKNKDKKPVKDQAKNKELSQIEDRQLL